jgi:uncharacterized protein involved in type VI secretion and phage assembly
MRTYKNELFALRLAGGGFEDFFPYRLELEEGLSRPFKGTLSIASETAHPRAELRALLDKTATLTVTQKLFDGKLTRTRSLHGIVSEVASVGVLQRGGKRECFGFALTIESELARLRYTRFSRPYYGLTPADLIQTILDKHHIEAQFPGEFLKRNDYSKKLMFDQSRLSDWDFLRSILSLYGISFTLRHPRAKGTALGKAELIFSEGTRAFPVSDVDYSDGRAAADKERFDFLSFDEGAGVSKMNAWREAASIGVDGVKLSAPYPNANGGSRDWRVGETDEGKRFYDYDRQFHGYAEDAGAGEIDADVMKALQARYRAFQIEKSAWRGEAANLTLVPGRVFELAHFNGAGSRETTTAMALRTRLACNTPLPHEMAPEEGGRTKVSVEAECMDYGKDAEKRFCDYAEIER